MSSKSSLKHNAKSYFEEISSFDLFYQLTYMSATAGAGISRARTFQLARELLCPPARYFKSIHQIAENLRYNYPDAVRVVGQEAKSEDTKNFLLRLSDALRSGEPLPGFLVRESEVQGERYSNDYTRNLEALKKWNDAYTAITVSAALIIIIEMVSTMIYNFGMGMMMMMVMIALASSFGVAWVLFRAAPQETKDVALAKGSKLQRLSLRLFKILVPASIVVFVLLAFLGAEKAYIFIGAALFMFPVGWVSSKADSQVNAKDAEISSFLRSLGGTATSRGTTLPDALASMKIDSFPSLQLDIRMLDLRLKAFGKPRLCWETFGMDTGSQLARQSIGVFYEAVNLGSDPDKAGKVTSTFAMRTAMLRAQRQGVAATFSWLIIVLHTVMAALMVFLLGVLEQFSVRLNTAMQGVGGSSSDAMGSMGLQGMFAFNTPQIDFLSMIVIGMILLLSIVNAFAIVACEGSHLVKITYYLAILMFLSGVGYLIVPSIVKSVM